MSGAAITSGFLNTVSGNNSGKSLTSGNNNSFFGNSSGQFNTNGSNNSLFGFNSGVKNIGGSNNSFFGVSAAGSGGIYTVEGTIGQNADGTRQQNSPYNFQPGFWTAQALAPTAASVNLGGRVLTANGGGIRNALIKLTMPDGTTRTTISSTFGYYSFADIPSGQTYILTARSKRFTFAAPTQVVTLFEERGDVDFIAAPLELQSGSLPPR